MIKTIIFDIGRVLVDFEPEKYLKSLYGDSDTAREVMRAYFSPEMHSELDRGVMDTEDIVRSCVTKAPEYETEIRRAFADMGKCITQREFAIPLIESLKKRGFQVLYLSNYSAHVKNLTAEQLSFLPHTDGGVFSYEVKLIKPDRRIYEAIIEKYGLTPSECIFIDDNEQNIAMANEIGINGIVYKTYEQVISDMERIISGENGSDYGKEQNI